jgi:hypothetical protein
MEMCALAGFTDRSAASVGQGMVAASGGAEIPALRRGRLGDALALGERYFINTLL